MNLRSTFVSGLLLLVCAGVGISQGVKSGVQLTTVRAPWLLRILGQELDITDVKAKPDYASAYFMMSSGSTYLNVSVFIEPVDKCKTSEACRDHVLSLGNPEWGTYQDLKKGTLGAVSYFEFYRPEVKGRPAKMLDMYAEFVADGYWVDMHISKVLYDPAKDHVLFENVVKGTKLDPKTTADMSELAAMIAKANVTTASWLNLWDSNKCAESYAAMSSISRAENTPESWLGYCNKAHTYLGAKTVRSLIGVAFTSSMPPKTDRPLGIFAYQSGFANRPSVVEIVGLLLEKDGRWVVTNYLPQ